MGSSPHQDRNDGAPSQTTVRQAPCAGQLTLERHLVSLAHQPGGDSFQAHGAEALGGADHFRHQGPPELRRPAGSSPAGRRRAPRREPRRVPPRGAVACGAGRFPLSRPRGLARRTPAAASQKAAAEPYSMMSEAISTLRASERSSQKVKRRPLSRYAAIVCSLPRAPERQVAAGAVAAAGSRGSERSRPRLPEIHVAHGQPAGGPQHPPYLAQHRRRVCEAGQEALGEDHIEGGGFERQVGGIAKDPFHLRGTSAGLCEECRGGIQPTRIHTVCLGKKAGRRPDPARKIEDPLSRPQGARQRQFFGQTQTSGTELHPGRATEGLLLIETEIHMSPLDRRFGW